LRTGAGERNVLDREDRVLLRDMLDVCLLDESWLAKLTVDLAARLKELIDTPNG
jgi:hypothetical protein